MSFNTGENKWWSLFILDQLTSTVSWFLLKQQVTPLAHIILTQSQSIFGLGRNVMLILIIISDLSSNLKYQVYGQHLVLKAVVRHLKAHLSNNDPSKALALSFHGGTGTGKNHVSKIIANHVFKEGMKSKFVHMIASTKEFPHVDMVPLYKVYCFIICK